MNGSQTHALATESKGPRDMAWSYGSVRSWTEVKAVGWPYDSNYYVYGLLFCMICVYDLTGAWAHGLGLDVMFFSPCGGGWRLTVTCGLSSIGNRYQGVNFEKSRRLTSRQYDNFFVHYALVLEMSSLGSLNFSRRVALTSLALGCCTVAVHVRPCG